MPAQQSSETNSDLVALDGIVRRCLDNDLFEVELDGGRRVLVHPTGTVRQRVARVGSGVRVRVLLFRYDPTRGRIVGLTLG